MTVTTATARSSAETVELFNKYVVPNYRRYPISLVRGEGSHVWDAEGNRYLDLFPGWGCNLLGHCPPRAHYDGFLWGFVTTFQVITGENWNEVMYVAVAQSGMRSVAYFVVVTVVGNLVVLNLFLGVLTDTAGIKKQRVCLFWFGGQVVAVVS